MRVLWRKLTMVNYSTLLQRESMISLLFKMSVNPKLPLRLSASSWKSTAQQGTHASEVLNNFVRCAGDAPCAF